MTGYDLAVGGAAVVAWVVLIRELILRVERQDWLALAAVMLGAVVLFAWYGERRRRRLTKVDIGQRPRRTGWHSGSCPEIWGYGCDCGGDMPRPPA